MPLDSADFIDFVTLVWLRPRPAAKSVDCIKSNALPLRTQREGIDSLDQLTFFKASIPKSGLLHRDSGARPKS
jgi:hypothetical protein